MKLPGIGKTAERLIVEMKDRFKGLHGDLYASRRHGTHVTCQPGD